MAVRKTAIAKRAGAPAVAPLLDDLRALIDAAQARVAAAVNAELTVLYWRIGRRINADVLRGRRAGYGEEIVATLSQELSARYGRGFSYPALTRMQRFAEWLPEEAAVATLSQQLSWSHVVELLPLPDSLQREFYARMGAAERWSVRTLRERIDSMLYERTALSRRPRAQIEQELAALRDAERMTPAMLLRDPYLLDFLGLRDTWSESDLEARELLAERLQQAAAQARQQIERRAPTPGHEPDSND